MLQQNFFLNVSRNLVSVPRLFEADFDIVLFQIYWTTSVPNIIKIERSLTKLLQK